MIKKRTWAEFREIGLLWWINRLLHTFGWAICFDPDSGECYPARCKFRGFDEKSEDEGFAKMQDNFTQEHLHDVKGVGDE
tara:strand:+ start:152 stop:391 length:240 start_codon:yes stop_codon:yes gene_type:complete